MELPPQQPMPMMGPVAGGMPLNQGPIHMPMGAGGPESTTSAASAGPQGRPVDNYQSHLNTYIYDYLLRNELWDLARLWVKTMTVVTGAPSGDSKSKRPVDLPEPSIPPHCSDTSFLLDWWCQFWDVFSATRGGNTIAAHYLKHAITLSKARQENQSRMLRTGMPVSGAMFGPGMQSAMARPGMEMPAAMAPNPNAVAAMAAMQQRRPGAMPQRMPPQHMIQQQNGMRRDASAMDMHMQHSQTQNAGGDNPSSPKRPRQDGGPSNGAIMPVNRQNMPMNGNNVIGPGQNGANPGMIQMGVAGNMPTGPGGPGAMRPMSQNAHQENSANALQDYQQQLMLLEQQNKKRLLKAKQEQDNVGPPPAGTGPLGHPAFVAPTMSPSGSRAGPSPNPEQLKRVTSGLNQTGSPMNDGSRRPVGSPATTFDAQVPQFMDKNMSQSGPMNARPPSAMSNPPLMPPGMNHNPLGGNPGTQINGSWNPPPGMPNPAPPMGTPQQRASVTTAMGPPPAPVTNDQQRLQSSSPSQTGPPPTPSQVGKGGPKGKKETRKAPQKRSASTTTAATSVATNSAVDMEPPTPTSAAPPNTVPPGNFIPNMAPSVSNDPPPMSTASHPSMSQMPELGDPNDPAFLLEPSFAALDGMNDGSMAGYDDLFDFTSGPFGLDSPHFT